MEDLLLPLFPLEVVLFPEAPLPLHIFEERYKDMIGVCLRAKEENEGQQEFGVVLARGRDMETIGCAARIVNVVRKYDDGRMDIFTVGTRRFEIVVANPNDPTTEYTRAGVDYFDDDPGAVMPVESEAEQVIARFKKIVEKLRRTSDIPIHFPKPYRHLSYRIATALPFDLDFKQKLLAMRSEPERLHHVDIAIATLIPQIEMVERVRAKAGGNGHGRIQF